MAQFLMPILGADMRTGTVIAWRKQPGELVHRDEVIVEVETDKVNIEVEAFTEGVLDQILVQPGEQVPVGTPLAIIRQEGEAPGDQLSTPRSVGGVAAPSAPSSPMAATQPAVSAPIGPRARVSPAARKLADELGVDLVAVVGTGPGARIQLEDVRAAASARAPSPPAVPDRQVRMRQAIAAAMSHSHREIPAFHVTTTIDMSRPLSWLAEQNQHRSVADRLLYGALLIKAVARALREVPELNAVWAGDHVELKPSVHVGMAIALRGGGLVVPALHDADQKSPDELMKSFLDLVQRARSGTLRASEMSDSTITITNLGEQGAESVFGLIYPPQVALVGFGRIVERPWVVEGQIVPRPVMTATLTGDHRVADGHRGSVFLAEISRLLQETESL